MHATAERIPHLSLLLIKVIIMRKLSTNLAIFFCLLAFYSCNNSTSTAAVESVSITNDTATINGHPAWINEGNIYEVNVRQYTPEGTFNAFAKHLDRLKDMGVQTLWF